MTLDELRDKLARTLHGDRYQPAAGWPCDTCTARVDTLLPDIDAYAASATSKELAAMGAVGVVVAQLMGGGHLGRPCIPVSYIFDRAEELDPDPEPVSTTAQIGESPRPVRVTATDLERPEDVGTVDIMDDYVIIVAGTARVANVQAHANGTHVITVKGVKRVSPS